MASDIHKKDLYEILGVPEKATSKEIVRGYRKRALKCHPDKNRDNPRATQLFLELSQALEILTDEAARAAYDHSRNARRAAEERNKVLDVKRRKLKDDLETRERLFDEKTKVKTERADKELDREIDRLRKEGSRLVEEEQERMRQELQRTLTQKFTDSASESDITRIKLKWRAQKDDPENGGYSRDVLHRILSCYGQINTLLVSDKRNGSAIVEFEKCRVSSQILDETGLAGNPLIFTWLSGKPDQNKTTETFSTVKGGGNTYVPHGCGDPNQVSGTSFSDRANLPMNSQVFTGSVSQGRTFQDKNYESLVLMKMRQAGERKRLIEQMMKEDNEDT